VSKIGDSVIALWSRVLLAIPDSRLLIAAIPEARVQNRLQASFAARGIAPERLDLRARLPMREYLMMHHEVDIALDTFPYSGGTTTRHALWMGIPVITLTGPGLQQNHGSAILETLGLSDWAVGTEPDFVARAVRAASDLNALSGLRQELRERVTRTFLGSEDEVGRELDSALRMIWRRWCARQQLESATG
jgi:predicted O-linked N-acetylglucosamine transferase (SPINDLY family)